MKTRLDLKFKGERNYLHGTDILNETMAWLETCHAPQKLSNIEFSFHRMAKSALDLHDEKQDDMGDYAAECVYRTEAEVRHVYLYESGEPVQGRYPYDEDLICRGFQVDVAGKSGCLLKCAHRDDPPFTDIEIWVSLTKALHQRALPEIKGKWLFVRGSFPYYDNSSKNLERSLLIKSNFQNRLTRTELSSGGVYSGEIFFSVI